MNVSPPGSLCDTNTHHSPAIDTSDSPAALRVPVPQRFDCSVIEVECDARHYSASRIAQAVEDADVPLTDLLTRPGSGNNIIITLRVRTDDPAFVEASLQRYGYNVLASHSLHNSATITALERLGALEAYLNV